MLKGLAPVVLVGGTLGRRLSCDCANILFALWQRVRGQRPAYYVYYTTIFRDCQHLFSIKSHLTTAKFRVIIETACKTQMKLREE